MHFSFTESKSLPKSRLCVQTLYTYSGERSKGKGAEAFRGRASGNRQDKKSLATLDQMSCRVSSS
jgi:hypothetical protein